jgi:SAM-dependent methyltransferase
MLNYYARRAAEYESIYDKPERQADLIQLRTLIVELFSGRDLLELACGTGYWTQVVAASARSITATDLTPEVIEIAKAKSYRLQPEFLIADAYLPANIAGNFDAALAAFWWSHVPKEKCVEFLNQLHRRMPSGSLIVFFDNRYVAGSSTPVCAADDNGNTYQDRKLADGSTHRVLKNFPGSQELRALLETKATGVEILELQYYWLVKYYSK